VVSVVDLGSQPVLYFLMRIVLVAEQGKMMAALVKILWELDDK
jgi:hypothetical protein